MEEPVARVTCPLLPLVEVPLLNSSDSTDSATDDDGIADADGDALAPIDTDIDTHDIDASSQCKPAPHDSIGSGVVVIDAVGDKFGENVHANNELSHFNPAPQLKVNSSADDRRITGSALVDGDGVGVVDASLSKHDNEASSQCFP